MSCSEFRIFAFWHHSLKKAKFCMKITRTVIEESSDLPKNQKHYRINSSGEKEPGFGQGFVLLFWTSGRTSAPALLNPALGVGSPRQRDRPAWGRTWDALNNDQEEQKRGETFSEDLPNKNLSFRACAPATRRPVCDLAPTGGKTCAVIVRKRIKDLKFTRESQEVRCV
ncbi:hypothetical protein JTE90_010718 [Oedothorax gibbosus]|uniref:Uncharacterized protein n=1 Tax=Oedothorax gibbosus TaxID=931172 RepID=A0AAV6UNB3_9ARAC|nr:hypothetical protein JTE90_010718 [Oedothorax gibbosus]